MTPKGTDMGRSPELCETLRSLGYRSGQTVRLYGEDLHIISDPFPDGEHIAVQAKSAGPTSIQRMVRIPLPIINIARERKAA